MSPLLLLSLVLVTAFLEPCLPMECKSAAYALAITAREILLLILPLIIFLLVSSGIMQLKTQTVRIGILLFILIFISNLTSTWISYGASLITPHTSIPIISTSIEPLKPMWDLTIPKIFSNNQAILAAIILSLGAIIFTPGYTGRLIKLSQNFAYVVLNKLLMPITPIFILGFMIKMAHNGELFITITHYLHVLITFTLSASAYLFCIYLLLMSTQNIKQAKNMIPACITAFSTMSSALALPMLLTASVENTRKREIIEPILPCMVNFHIVGDSFFIPMISLAIINASSMSFPTPYHYLIFSLQFTIANFSMASVPSGGIIIMLPLLEQSSFGFTDNMLTIFTVLYAIFDPFISSFNVLGNGAFCMLFTKCYEKLSKYCNDSKELRNQSKN